MGACFVERSFPDCSKDELKKHVSQAAAEAGHESGHSYSGDWGSKNCSINFIGREFDSYEAAVEYMEEHNDKWGPLDAARVKQHVRITNANKGSKLTVLETKLQGLEKRQKEFMPGILERTLKTKSQLKSCEHCDSKINVKAFMKHAGWNYAGTCPICQNNLLLTKTDIAAKTKLDADLAAARAQMKTLAQERSKALTKKSEYIWVVGGWCSS